MSGNKIFGLQNHVLLAKREYSLILDNFSLSSQQLVPNYILYPCKCPDVHLRRILAQFWRNKPFPRPAAIFFVWIVNGPFPSSLQPLFQKESKCETFHMKMSSECSFIFMQIKVIFIRMVLHLDSLWSRGTRELGYGLFANLTKLSWVDMTKRADDDIIRWRHLPEWEFGSKH